MGNPIELAKKLKALADQGVGGEKRNATDILEKFMAKHGISLNELIDEEIKEYSFKVVQNDTKLFAQILWAVSGLTSHFTKGRKKSVLYVKITASQAIEISAKLHFYAKLLKEEYDLLYLSFIHKHEIFNETPIQGKSESKLDAEDRMRIAKMMSALKDETFQKQIENSRGA